MRATGMGKARKVLLLLAVVAACLWAYGCAAEAQEAPASPALAPGERPNVVVVMADDLGVETSDLVEGLNTFGNGGPSFRTPS